MYRCCIFDLDGTLLNTIHALTYTVNLTLGQFGLGPIDESHTKQFVGNGYAKLVERALQHCGDEKPEHYEEALKVYLKNFELHSMYRLEAYDGIDDLLWRLKEQGVQLAVVTNKVHERAVENLDFVFGEHFFDMIIGEREGFPRKPDPSPVLAVIGKLNVKKESCLYIGDTGTDMETGRNAGVHTAGVTWGFRGRAELEAYHPEFIFDHPAQIRQLFENLPIQIKPE